jgi:hypothetical protein
MNAPAILENRKRKALRGLAELIDEPAKEIRRKDPPTQAQAAAERAREREAKFDLASEIERLAARIRAEPPPAPPPIPPPRTPRPPVPPQARGPLIDAKTSPATRRAILRAQANVAAGSAPCLLTREQLGPGPSEFMLRQMRAVRDRYEIEAAKQRERDSLRALR